jgi:hypothetical protein
MAQASLQYTPVQVLQAARRAEAEGKMDYALQFYRHLVEQHSSSVEAQEAREGLFRIAEWRWGEARVARRQEAANNGQQANHGHQPYTIAASSDYPPESANRLPQIIAREAAKAAAKDEAPVFKSRYRAARNIAVLVSGVGWLSAIFGVLVAVLAIAGATTQVSEQVLMGVPVGFLVGMPLAMFGLLLVIAGQVGMAVFESTNATLELLSIERGRLSF